MATISRMYEVPSENVGQVGYDPADRELWAIFRNAPRTLYVYSNITPEAYCSILNASSVGKRLLEVVKGAKYKKATIPED